MSRINLANIGTVLALVLVAALVYSTAQTNRFNTDSQSQLGAVGTSATTEQVWLEKSEFQGGETFSVSWNNQGTVYPLDWVGITTVGGAWGSAGTGQGTSWFYTGGYKSASKPLVAPSTPGDYELVYYQDNSTDRILERIPLRVISQTSVPTAAITVSTPAAPAPVAVVPAASTQTSTYVPASIPTPASTQTSTGSSIAPSANDPAAASFLQLGTGALSRTFLDKGRDTLSVKDCGARGNSVANDTAALRACASLARASNQRELTCSRGTYIISAPINVSGISLIGEGAVGCTILAASNFAGDALLLLDGSTEGGAANSRYSNFRLHGNRRVVGSAIAGMQLKGNVLYNSFDTIRINEVKGPGVLIRGDGSRTFRPSLNTFINVNVSSGDSHGWEIRAGLSNTFIGIGAEALGGRGISVTSADETVGRLSFIAPWIEGVGIGQTGFYLNAFGVQVINALVQDYGSSPATTGHGFEVLGGLNVIEAPDVSGRAASAPGSRKIKISGGTRHQLGSLSAAFTTRDVEDPQGDTLITNAWNIELASKEHVFLSNASAAIEGGTIRYMQLGTGFVSATYADVRQRITAPITLLGFRLEATQLPGGTGSYVVQAMVDGVAVGPKLVLNNANKGTTNDLTNELNIPAGSFLSWRVISTPGAATIQQGGLHLSYGIRK